MFVSEKTLEFNAVPKPAEKKRCMTISMCRDQLEMLDSITVPRGSSSKTVSGELTAGSGDPDDEKKEYPD